MPEHYHPDQPPEREPTDAGLTGYAIAKYGFMLIITIVVLYFIAAYILPLI